MASCSGRPEAEILNEGDLADLGPGFGALFAPAPGHLNNAHAVLVKGTLDWTYELGVEIGPAVAADTNADGLLELLLTAGDGSLYAIGQETDLGTIAEVIDGQDEDLDLVPLGTPGFSPQSFTARWSAPEGGSTPPEGYLLRLVTDTGAIVADWEDVGNTLSATRTLSVPLVPGQRYLSTVLPYGLQSSGQPSSSDGFELHADWFVVDEPDVPVASPDAVESDDVSEERGTAGPRPSNPAAPPLSSAPPTQSAPAGVPTQEGCRGADGPRWPFVWVLLSLALLRGLSRSRRAPR